MHPIRVFASFDRSRDGDLGERLLGQSRSSDSPFEVADWSGNGSVPGDASLRERMDRVDALIVLCGEHTDSSIEVSLELRTAQDQRKPYFLIRGRRELTCTKPVGAKADDTLYTWIWQILKLRIGSEMRRVAALGSAA
jgi:antiphage defense system Thoeris ThsB-like protein